MKRVGFLIMIALAIGAYFFVTSRSDKPERPDGNVATYSTPNGDVGEIVYTVVQQSEITSTTYVHTGVVYDVEGNLLGVIFLDLDEADRRASYRFYSWNEEFDATYADSYELQNASNILGSYILGSYLGSATYNVATDGTLVLSDVSILPEYDIEANDDVNAVPTPQGSFASRGLQYPVLTNEIFDVYKANAPSSSFSLSPTVIWIGVIAVVVLVFWAFFKGLIALFEGMGMSGSEAQTAAALTGLAAILGAAAAASEASKKSSQQQQQQSQSYKPQPFGGVPPKQPTTKTTSAPATPSYAAPQRVACKTCNGSGKSRCSNCGGGGWVADRSMGMAGEHYQKKCSGCGGSGTSTCSSCYGRGYQ